MTAEYKIAIYEKYFKCELCCHLISQIEQGLEVIRAEHECSLEAKGEAMSLPEWIQNHTKLSDEFGYNEFGYTHDRKLFEALTIAWEALENIEKALGNGSEENAEESVAYHNAKDAMRRIEELGK